MIDLSKLTPAPWEADFDEGMIDGVLRMVQHGNINTTARTGQAFSHTDLEFIALARNAFDVMMRRKWTPHWNGEKFCVVDILGEDLNFYWDDAVPRKVASDFAPQADDPFTALVEADKWWAEREGSCLVPPTRS